MRHMFFLLFLFPPFSHNCFQSAPEWAALGNDSSSYVTTSSYPSEVFVPRVASKMLTFNKYLRKLARRQWLSRRLLEPGVSSRALCTAGGKKKEAGKFGVVCSCTQPISH